MRADLGSAVPSFHISKVKVFTEELQEKYCLANSKKKAGCRKREVRESDRQEF